MATAIEKFPPQGEHALEVLTPTGLLQMAVAQGADIDKLAKLMELQQRWEANEARKAFSVAFSAFKSEAVRVVKNTEVKAGPLAGTKYANLFDVVNAVVPALSKHGLSHSWKLSKDEKEWMEVTCTVRHVLGHSESVSMGAAPDAGPGRNAIQARASAKNYLERYTLLAVTGLAAGAEDDDGAGASRLPESEVAERMDWIRQANDLAELQKIFTAAYKGAQEAGDKEAMAMYIKLKDERKKALHATH